MKQLTIQTATATSHIFIGDVLGHHKVCAPTAKTVFVIDENVASLHPDAFPDGERLLIHGGEVGKSLAATEQLYAQFLERCLDRTALVIGVGGGTVCDLVAFAAATYLRGLRCALIPTTLLAQVDASIGGKNGVNFGGYKNLVGVIRQPEFVLCDPRFLTTLPEQEFRNGMAEVIKHAAIADAKLFAHLKKNAAAIMSRDAVVLEELLHAVLVVKANIVAADEMEQGERVKLNFGHTLGHAIESTCQMAHGEAVSIGMLADAQLSVAQGLLAADKVPLLRSLLETYGLPTTLCGEKERLLDAIRQDKKRRGEAIQLGLLTAIGSSTVVTLPRTTLERFLDDLYKHS